MFAGALVWVNPEIEAHGAYWERVSKSYPYGTAEVISGQLPALEGEAAGVIKQGTSQILPDGKVGLRVEQCIGGASCGVTVSVGVAQFTFWEAAHGSGAAEKVTLIDGDGRPPREHSETCACPKADAAR